MRGELNCDRELLYIGRGCPDSWKPGHQGNFGHPHVPSHRLAGRASQHRGTSNKLTQLLAIQPAASSSQTEKTSSTIRCIDAFSTLSPESSPRCEKVKVHGQLYRLVWISARLVELANVNLVRSLCEGSPRLSSAAAIPKKQEERQKGEEATLPTMMAVESATGKTHVNSDDQEGSQEAVLRIRQRVREAGSLHVRYGGVKRYPPMRSGMGSGWSDGRAGRR